MSYPSTRPRSADPVTVYLAINAALTLCNATAFTLVLVFYARELHLGAFQTVLIGSVLEASCLLLQLPTGVAADLVGRKPAVVLGTTTTTVSLGVLGLAAGLGLVLVAMVLWGAGFTFVAGAIEAWLTDEVGADRAEEVFHREQQLDLAATVLGTLAAGGLSLLGLRVPVLVAAAGVALVTIGVAVLMRERNFTPVPRAGRTAMRTATGILIDGLRAAARRRVVRSFLLVGVLTGVSSEAFDRLWTLRVLTDFPLPHVLGHSDTALWFTGFALVGTLIGLVASLLANRFARARLRAAHPNRLLAVLTALQVVGVLGFALAGDLWVALAAMWLRDAASAVAQPVQVAWLNRDADPAARATVLSLGAGSDALGQIVGGPPIGALAGRIGLGGGIAVAGVALAPVVVLFARLRPRPSSAE